MPSALERYSDALKRKYSEYKLKAIVDWPPPPAENIVKLAMIGDPKIDDKFIGDMTQGNVRSVLKTKTVIEPVDLFQRIESGGGKVILLEGAPGSGKSTMCWYICKQWGEGTLLQGFTHVLMIELRDKTIQAVKHLVQILPYILGHDNRVAEDLIKKHGDNVLVILEGWNELPKPLRKESIFKDLVTKGGRSPLQNAVVLVSSRSNTTVDLQQYIALQVEALGFTPDQIKAYVEGCFESKGEPHRAQELLAIINRNPKLRENCYLPLMLIIIVHLYDCSKTLPESFCAIIIELALSCLYRYCKENGILDLEDSMVSLDDVPSQLQPRVYELCELAYNATVNERYSFSDPQTDGLGLLQNVRSIAARGSEVTQYFLHSSLQELCAALHVSRQPVPNQKEMLEHLFEAPKDYVLRFYSALTSWKNESVVEVLFKHSKSIQHTMEKLVIIPAMPEPLSQAWMMIVVMSWNARKRILSGKKPFEGEQLALLGIPDYESFERDMSECLQEIMKQDTFDFGGRDGEKMKNVMLNAWGKIATQKGIDPSSSSTYLKAMFEKLQGFGFEPFFQELCESFGTDQIPFMVIFEQIMQRLQQEFNQTTEDPRQMLSLPPSEGQLSQHMIENQMKIMANNGSYFRDVMSLMTLKPNPGPEEFREALKIWHKISNGAQLHNNSQMLALFYGTDSITALMFLHCVYEARNPLLVPLLGSSLALKGNLNGGDLLALQSVFQMIKNSRLSHSIKTLYLTTASSPTDMDVVLQGIESVKTLELSIGKYDETVVTCILKKSSVMRLKYDWMIPDEGVRIESCTSFCKCLEHNQILQVLDLSGVPMLDVGARELAKVLNTTQVVNLNLSRCGIEKEGFEELLEALESNCSLTELHLHETKITPADLESLSCLLIKNNTLKTIGMIEEPLASERTEENLREFIVRLCFNSSVTCLMLHGQYTHTPLLQQALSLVNLTRKLKQQPLLSIDDHYPKNYSPDLYDEFGIRPWEIGTKALKPINRPTVMTSRGCYLMEELPTQVWMQTLSFSLSFITESKAIRNVSMKQIMKPNSKAILVNVQSRVYKPRSKTVTMVEAQRILFPEKELPLQEQHGTLCDSLQFITRCKAVHALCIRNPLPRRRARRKDVIVEVNGHLSDPTSQYPVVVEALQKQRPFSSQPWQQTLFCTQQFIRQSKAIRDMCTSKLLRQNNQKINIRFKTPQHTITEYSRIMSSVTVHKGVDPEKEYEDHVHTAKCMAILLSVIRTLPGDVNRPLQECPSSTTNNVLLNNTVGLHSAVPRDLISESCERHKITSPASNILLPHLLHYLSFLLTY